MRLLYDLGISAYTLLLRGVSPCHVKAKKWVDGRRHLFSEIERAVGKDMRPIWFHFASLGEFEQGRSVMEAIKRKYPHEKILITFFSPSGYEIRKNTPLADYVFYLPTDTGQHARRFLDLVDPKLAIFTKYEYWYHYFRELRRRKIRLLMISAIFREEQIFFKWYGGFFRKILRQVSFFFTQNIDSVYWLKSIHITQAGLAGDTRFDRVVDIPKHGKPVPEVERFITGSAHVVVAGSTWPQDEVLLEALLSERQTWKAVVAPHEVDEAHIRQIKERFPTALLFSQFRHYTPDDISEAQVLIIDNIGMLSSLYGYGSVAYIGGGFGAGIHNTLEAATYGIPVVFGPKYGKFQEAVDLIEHGAAFCIQNRKELNDIFSALENPKQRNVAGTRARGYVEEKAGATPIIMKYLETERLLS